MSFFLPLPPNPDESQYASPLAYQRALFQWALQTKGRLEQSNVLSNGVSVSAPAIGQIPIKGNNAWLPGYIGTSLAAGGGISITGTATSTIAISKGQIPGTITNDSASAGNVGEYFSSSVGSGTSAVSLSNGTAANVANVALTPGDYDVWINGAFTGGATTTVTNLDVSLSTSSAALDTTNGRYAQANPAGATALSAGNYYLNAGPARLSLTGTSTVYFVAQAGFAISTCGAFGIIQARRRR